jgi:hypothetical protein
VTQQFHRAIHVASVAHPDEDPVVPGTSQIDARVTSELIAKFTNTGAREPHVDLAAMAVRDLAAPEPERVGVSSLEARGTSLDAANPRSARHEFFLHRRHAATLATLPVGCAP